MDILDEYKELMTQDYVDAHILGKKIKIKKEKENIYVYDTEGFLTDYKNEYIVLCIIMDDAENGESSFFSGKLYAKGDNIYFINTSEQNPKYMPYFYPKVNTSSLQDCLTSKEWTVVSAPADPSRRAWDTSSNHWVTTIAIGDTLNNNGAHSGYLASSGDVIEGSSIDRGVTTTDFISHRSRIVDTDHINRNGNYYPQDVYSGRTLSINVPHIVNTEEMGSEIKRRVMAELGADNNGSLRRV